MKITITINKEAVDVVKLMAREVIGRKPTKKELEKFFTQDIYGVYGDTFEDGIGDAVECHFG
jgi:hypothetical protein